jgi:hypothetical protein
METQTLEGEWLPLVEASQRMGMSVQTLRRRLKEGKLRSRQSTTSHGLAWQVWVSKIDHSEEGVEGQDNLDPIEESNQLTNLDGSALATLPTLQLIQWLKELQQENRELASKLGYTQAQLEQAHEKVLMLEDPKPELEPRLEESRAEPKPWWLNWWNKLTFIRE